MYFVSAWSIIDRTIIDPPGANRRPGSLQAMASSLQAKRGCSRQSLEGEGTRRDASMDKGAPGKD